MKHAQRWLGNEAQPTTRASTQPVVQNQLKKVMVMWGAKLEVPPWAHNTSRGREGNATSGSSSSSFPRQRQEHLTKETETSLLISVSKRQNAKRTDDDPNSEKKKKQADTCRLVLKARRSVEVKEKNRPLPPICENLAQGAEELTSNLTLVA